MALALVAPAHATITPEVSPPATAYATTLPVDLNVTLPAGVDGLLCGGNSTGAEPNVHTATWDPGGGTQVQKSVTVSGRHTSGATSFFFVFDKSDLPQGGVTDVVRFTGTNYFVGGCVVLQTTNDNGISVAQTGTDNEASPNPISVVLGMARAAGSLVAQCVTSTSEVAFTFGDLSTEIVDLSGAGGGGNGGACAYQVNPTETTTYEVLSSTGGNRASAVIEITEDAPASSPPSFSAGPTESTNTATTVQFTFTPSASATFYWALRNSGTSAFANCAALISEVGSPTSASLERGSKAVTGADSVTVDFDHYEGDFDACLSNGDGDSAVSTLNDVVRNACTGCSVVELTSLSATSPFTVPTESMTATMDSDVITDVANPELYPVGTPLLTSARFADSVVYVVDNLLPGQLTVDQVATASGAFTGTGYVFPDGTSEVIPTPAAGAWLEWESMGGDVVFDGTWELDADVTPPVTIVAKPQDVSDSTPEYAAPFNCRSGTGDCSIYVGYLPPVFDIEPIQSIALTVGGSAPSLAIGAMCSHSLLSSSVQLRDGETPPSGMAFDSANQEIDITNLVENESGVDLQLLCGAGRKYALQQWTFYPIDTVTMIDVTGDTLEVASAAIAAAFPWREEGQPISTPGCNPSGTVVSSDPAAMEEMAAYADISLTLSDGIVCAMGRGKGVTMPGISPFL